MSDIGIFGLVILVLNLIVSYKGFTDQSFFERFKFQVEAVLHRREYWRIITSGFLHVGWMHLAFNMFALTSFSGVLEVKLGISTLVVIYFASMIAGDLFALFRHRYHGGYSAVGASGAVSGVVFAYIALMQEAKLSMLFLPISFPAWVFGLGYTLYTIYGIHKQNDNIGHEAHFGGGLAGMLIAICINPSVVLSNYLPILGVLLPSVLFLIWVLKSPSLFSVGGARPLQGKLTKDQRYNAEKKVRQDELDRILDKISRKGYEKLSEREKAFLEEVLKK